MWKRASFLKSSSLLFCLSLLFPPDGFSAIKQRRFRDIYLERRLEHGLNAGEAEKMEKEYRQMEKEIPETGGENWDKNLKNFIDRTKKRENSSEPGVVP